MSIAAHGKQNLCIFVSYRAGLQMRSADAWRTCHVASTRLLWPATQMQLCCNKKRKSIFTQLLRAPACELLAEDIFAVIQSIIGKKYFFPETLTCLIITYFVFESDSSSVSLRSSNSTRTQNWLVVAH